MRQVREIEREVLAVNATLAAVKRFDCRDVDTLQVQVKNVGTVPLTGFSVAMRACAGGAPPNAHVPVQSADFTTPSQVVPWVSSDPASLAAAGVCIVTIAVEEMESVELSFAASGSGTRAIELSAGLYAID